MGKKKSCAHRNRAVVKMFTWVYILLYVTTLIKLDRQLHPVLHHMPGVCVPIQKQRLSNGCVLLFQEGDKWTSVFNKILSFDKGMIEKCIYGQLALRARLHKCICLLFMSQRVLQPRFYRIHLCYSNSVDGTMSKVGMAVLTHFIFVF